MPLVYSKVNQMVILTFEKHFYINVCENVSIGICENFLFHLREQNNHVYSIVFSSLQ